MTLVAAGVEVSPVAASETDEGETITTVLYPGWNLVGWVGPDTPTSDLFDAIRALRQVWAWDAESQSYQLALRDQYGDLPTLTLGMGLWLRLGGRSSYEWRRAASDQGVLLDLRGGQNLLAWTREDGAAVADALARFGDDLLEVWHWDAERQRYVPYPPGSDAARLATLARGQALRIELARDTRWWEPGTARPTFVFADDVTGESRDAVRVATEDVRAVFAEYFGVHTTDFTVSINQEPGCFARSGFMKLTASAGCIAHEYFHVLQFALAGGELRGPEWMIEGPARFAEAVYADTDTRPSQADRSFEQVRRFAIAGATRVPSIQDPQEASPKDVDYNLGFLVTEWLVNRIGAGALASYYRLLPAHQTWESALEAAFGINVDDFYTAFEDYRASVARPLPSLTDDAVQPVVVFLGDVPAGTRHLIRDQVQSVHLFLHDRFAAPAVEYSLFVGSESDQLADRVRQISPRDLPEPVCAIRSGQWIVHTISCEGTLDASLFIHQFFEETLRYSRWSDASPPLWVESGGRRYVDVAYRLEHSPLPEGHSLDEEMFSLWRSVDPTVPIERISDPAGWNNESSNLALLAVHRLVSFAGEQSLFEYYRLLPRTTDPGSNSDGWRGAFEQAFGLTIEEFYEQFEAYRETLTGE